MNGLCIDLRHVKVVDPHESQRRKAQLLRMRHAVSHLASAKLSDAAKQQELQGIGFNRRG